MIYPYNIEGIRTDLNRDRLQLSSFTDEQLSDLVTKMGKNFTPKTTSNPIALYSATNYAPIIESKSPQDFFAQLKGAETSDMPYGGNTLSLNKNGIAIISLQGEMRKSPSWFDYFLSDSGIIDTAATTELFYAIAKEASIKGVILKIDSPGGEVNGTKELINSLMALKTTKPVVALVSQAASCACWLQTACHYSIATSSMAVCGSIGVFMVHVDRSSFYAQNGYKLTYIVSAKSPFKAIGNDTEPLSEKDKDFLLQEVNSTRDKIAKDIRAFRPNLDEEAFSGAAFYADVAKRLSLIDEITAQATNPTERAMRKVIELSKIKP